MTYANELEKIICVEGILSSFNIDHYNDGNHPANLTKRVDIEWKERHVRSVVHVWCNKLLELLEEGEY